MGIDPAPNYDWFRGFDYSWFDAGNLGNLSSIPFFETVPERLDGLVKTSSARQQLRLGFGPGDCETLLGSRNCTEACSDPSSLFTPTNLRACTALAGAALLVQNETYSVDRSDAQTVEAIDSWQVPDLSTFNATDVFAHVGRCIPQSCTVMRLGVCAESVQDLGSVEIKADSLALISSRLGHYCDGVDLEINTDIAGPGVGFFIASARWHRTLTRPPYLGLTLILSPDEPRCLVLVDTKDHEIVGPSRWRSVPMPHPPEQGPIPG